MDYHEMSLHGLREHVGELLAILSEPANAEGIASEGGSAQAEPAVPYVGSVWSSFYGRLSESG
jgi:hypothetical protein